MKVKSNIFCSIGLMVIAITMLFTTNLAAQPAEGIWSQFQGNAQHTGVSPFNGPQSEVYAKWTFPVNIGEGSPSIGPDGTIYITSFNGYGVYDDGTLYALNPDGTEKWSVYLGTSTRGAAAIDAEGRIYVGGSNGDLFAIDAPGIIQWVFSTPNSRNFGDAGIFGSPTIGDDGTVFVAGLDGLIYALDRQGNVKWENNVWRHNGDYNWFWGSAPAIGTDGNIYVQSTDRIFGGKGSVFAFDYQTGELKWDFSTGFALWMTPTVGSDGTVYVGGLSYLNGSFLYALKDLGADSQVLWSYPLNTSDALPSVAFTPDGKSLYFNSRLPGSNRYFLVKVDAMTGAEIWRFQPMSFGNMYGSAPIVGANGIVYIGTGNGDALNNNSVIAVSPEGAFLWRYNTGAVIWDTAAIGSDGTLYIGSDELHALVEINPSNNPPVADAGSDITITSEETTSTTIHGGATDADDDLLQYRWISAEGILQEWTPVGEQGDCPLNLASLSLDDGTHILTLDVSDGTVTASDSMDLMIGNSPPKVTANGGGVFELFSDVSLAGTVSDFDGDTLYYKWVKGETVLCSGTANSIDGGAAVALPLCVISELNLGTHEISLTVDDGTNGPVSSQVMVEIVDTTDPTLSPVANKGMLWPPNHKMVDIFIEANAVDNSGLPVTLSVEVASNEPTNGTGDGDTGPDWESLEIDQVAGVVYLQLRAERSGGGSGRIYTIIIKATDSSGNSSSSSVDVIVPHDKKKK